MAAVSSQGWDNRSFRLGDDMVVRLPSAEVYAAQVEKEQRWLPFLAARLPVSIPVPLARGRSGEGYPWPWSVRGWIDGETASVQSVADSSTFAGGAAGFLLALQQVDATDGPAPGAHNFHRGGPLRIYDAETRDAIRRLAGRIDATAALAAWEAALASQWQRPGVWIHGDVSLGNLLRRGDRLCAVIDFGQLGVGDPACDLAIAWTVFRGESRKVFRDRFGFDTATWQRGRGWALWKALIVAAGTVRNNAGEFADPWRVIGEVLNG